MTTPHFKAANGGSVVRIFQGEGVILPLCPEDVPFIWGCSYCLLNKMILCEDKLQLMFVLGIHRDHWTELA